MFIEQYKLERNPFAEDSVRPLFVSQSMRNVSLNLRKITTGEAQCLFVSGLAGSGKTTLLAHRKRSFVDISAAWISPDVKTCEMLLQKLLHDIGPGFVKGTLNELRNILSVYLMHQRLHGRLSLIIADGVERQSKEVMRELENLCQIRNKGLPAIQFVLLTRNEELVDELMLEHSGSGLSAATHSRLGGFTLEETKSYIRNCLQGAGCDWANELIPDSVVFDIQAFTQGVVGDINAICRDALGDLARRQKKADQQLKVTPALLKQVGKHLNLRHNPEAWMKPANEKISPDSVHVSDSWDLQVEAARLIVSSEGKQLAEISLNRPRMILGRDSTCDICLESHYLSRYQNLFMETDGGWVLIDLNSTNGCFVNGRRVREHRLRDGDLIGVGQHQLRFSKPGKKHAEREHNAPKDRTITAQMSADGKRWSM